MNGLQELEKAFFDIWMDEQYPYYYLTVGSVLVFLVMILIVSGTGLIWFYDWWWKLALSTIILIAVTIFTSKQLTKQFYLTYKIAK